MSTAIVIIAICALLVAAAVVQSTTAVLVELIRGLVAAVFVNIGRLFIIGVCLVCLLVILAH